MTQLTIQDRHTNDHVTIIRPLERGRWVHGDDEVGMEIEIKAKGFNGKYKAEFYEQDIVALRSGLQSMSKNLAEGLVFQTFGKQLEFTIKGDGRGHFTAEFQANSRDHIDNLSSNVGAYLIFSLEFDQTQIPGMIRELDEMLA